MQYRFGHYELDVAAFELRRDGARCDLEPQVFALLALLVENRDRLVSKDEIVEKVWDGRPVTDSAIASRVKSARQVLGDDGTAQRLIRTVHGQGYRFVADATSHRLNAPTGVPEVEVPARPSLAVLPFRLIGNAAGHEALAIALPDELIGELSRLRWLLVSARGSSFRLGGAQADPSTVGRLLGVRYCLSGAIETSAGSLIVNVELADTDNGAVVWAERLAGRLDDVHAIRAEICARILVQLDLRIPLHEAARARFASSENLDAWSAYHLGLQHVYRFNRGDNVAAQALFERAVAADPLFARAQAGLSFIHFQTAFMHYGGDHARAAALAREHAERALELDPLDPFVNFTMGRSYWLEGDPEGSLAWLDRATSLCPNYAQGIYARGWSEVMVGRPADSRDNCNLAMRLSPLDPLHYAMVATRAFTHIAMGEDGEAANWADRAARSPGAHVLIALVATVAHTLKGDAAQAGHWAANVRSRNASLSRDDFARAFPMKLDAMRQRILHALAQQGF
jgi:TolB-like protein/Tfp pilus assembly protein PilF